MLLNRIYKRHGRLSIKNPATQLLISEYKILYLHLRPTCFDPFDSLPRRFSRRTTSDQIFRNINNISLVVESPKKQPKLHTHHYRQYVFMFSSFGRNKNTKTMGKTFQTQYFMRFPGY